MINKEEQLRKFEEQLMPKIKDACVLLVDFFEEQALPSSYTACLGTYVENFLTFNAKSWEEHCQEYGVEIDFPEVAKEIEAVKSLDEYVEEFR